MKRLFGFFAAILLSSTYFIFPNVALAGTGSYCWCRETATAICTNHRTNQIFPSRAESAALTDDECNNYCLTYPVPSTAVNHDVTYRKDAICAVSGGSGCAPGQGSCTTDAASTPTSAPTTPGTAETVAAAPIHLYNPLGADTDIPAFIGRGIRGVLGLIGAIALLMFIYGGVTWMTAAGDSKRVEGAKNIIKNSMMGLLLIFFSYSLIGVFFSFFTGA
ncbi:MAG: pilin [Candidatus Uhrbacteria bacterium]